MRTVEFKYDLRQSVKIVAIGMIGKIDGLSLDQWGEQYRVIYWNDGGRYSVWMYDWEIEPVEK